ncbi:hypothetical protein WIS52_11220 [Pseudonocardia nematodicida]|uniref:Phosphoribosyl-ATP pyrophosphohydrolase n=1 Tax=Pseudonocardia nematodicida TaxID=1206997 RepID=A0ABV1K991_9PSEU
MGKLVRDRIPDRIRREGRESDVRVLDGAEFVEALKAKLREEADEVAAAEPELVPEELADVLKVLRAPATAHGLTLDRIEQLAVDERARSGTFDGRVYLDSW